MNIENEMEEFIEKHREELLSIGEAESRVWLRMFVDAEEDKKKQIELLRYVRKEVARLFKNEA